MNAEFLRTINDSDLFSGATVVITSNPPPDTEPNAFSLTVPRGLVCGLSDYFKSAFNSNFAERESREIKVDNVQPWVLSRLWRVVVHAAAGLPGRDGALR